MKGKKIIAMFLAILMTVTGFSVSASAAVNEYEVLWGYDLYDLLGLVRSNATYLDVTKENSLSDQYFNKMKASGSATVFAPYKFTLKRTDTITVDVEVAKDFESKGICMFLFNDDDEMYYDYNDFTYSRSSNFDKRSFSITVEDLPKGKYYMIFTGASNTKGKFSLTFSTDNSIEKKPQVTATALGDGKVKLKWKKISGATKYRVSKLVSGKYKTIKKSTTKTSYTVKGLTKNNSYKFAVQAYVNKKWTTLSLNDAVEIKAK